MDMQKSLPEVMKHKLTAGKQFDIRALLPLSGKIIVIAPCPGTELINLGVFGSHFDYTYTDSFEVTSDVKQQFDKDGYIIVRNLFNEEEMTKLSSVIENADEMKQFKFGVKDIHGNESAQITWNHPGNDVTGMAARCEKVAGTAEKLMGGECYHYHSKLVIKDPHAGGERAWHQDYGYWYQNGCLFPDMLTVFVAVDSANKENGCLQVLKGSHLCGRIEHNLVGAETGANLDRVAEIQNMCPIQMLETARGDAVFFHCNVLHFSAVNTSTRRRMGFLIAYNKASNNPVKESHHPRYTPLVKVPNNSVLECTNMTDLSGKDFLDMANLKTLKEQTTFEKSVK